MLQTLNLTSTARTNSWPSFSGLSASAKSGKSAWSARLRRRFRFRPVLMGLEDRRLLSLTTLASFNGTSKRWIT